MLGELTKCPESLYNMGSSYFIPVNPNQPTGFLNDRCGQVQWKHGRDHGDEIDHQIDGIRQIQGCDHLVVTARVGEG